MNSNFAFNNGMTIQIPPFNAASDQLFLAIKNYLDDRFNILDDKIMDLVSKNNEIGEYLVKIERDLRSIKSQRSESDKGLGSFKRRKVYKPLKRKLFTSTIVKTSPTNVNVIKTESVPCVESSLVLNSFLSNVNNVTLTNTKSENSEAQKEKSDITIRDESLEPLVILNPDDNREIFVGGDDAVRLSLWAYKKCLTCIRGKPNELSSRLCLRLLQAKFGRHYMLSHNYNGSGDKLPIDRKVMQAILTQVKMQFPDQDDMQNNPARFANFRDYINNAFRVVAYRHRKGIQSNTPFWDQNGDPIGDLDPPVWVIEHIK